MFYIYALKSLRNGLWYIGLTNDLRRRRQQHVRLRPDLYSKGHIFKVLAKQKSLFKTGQMERKLIKKYGTMWPGGNNLHPGGLTGHLLKFVREYGTEASDEMLASGSLYSAKMMQDLAAAIRQSKGKKAALKTLADQMMPQIVRDKIAIRAMQRRILSGIPLSHAGVLAQRRTAWRRHKAGLKPLPGTEHYLLQPEKCETFISMSTRYKMSQSQKKRIAKAKGDGSYKSPWAGRKTRPHKQSTKDLLSMRQRDRFAATKKQVSYSGLWNRRRRFWARHDKGLPPLPGTEIYFQQPRRPPTKPMSKESHTKRSQTMKEKFARWRKEGRPMPKPPAGSRGKTTQQQADKASATKFRKNLTGGLSYSYAAILAWSAKAKKRQAQGLSPIPGTECFVNLQTAPTKGPKYTSEQRLFYRNTMIQRVNKWLRDYAVRKGWRQN